MVARLERTASLSVVSRRTSAGMSKSCTGVRCVWYAHDCPSAVYCAVITHDGQRKNGFAECADDTMNPRGKGNYEGHERRGHKHRKLLKRIDLN